MELERKSFLLNSDIYQTVKQIYSCCLTHSDFVDFSSGEVLMDYETAIDLQQLLLGDSDYSDCIKIIHADNQRYNRLFFRVKYMMDLGQCMFLTLTFDEDSLKNSSSESRHNWVKRFLKRNFNCYVANIDFGKTTQREHFHAVVLGDDLKIPYDYPFLCASGALPLNPRLLE